MANDKETEDVTGRMAELENRITAIEALLADKVPGFEAVGVRVTELSAGFQQANGRLTAAQEAVERLSVATPPPGEARLSALETAFSALASQVQALAAVRSRSGLSGRLLSIEEKLDALLPVDPPEAPSDPE